MSPAAPDAILRVRPSSAEPSFTSVWNSLLPSCCALPNAPSPASQMCCADSMIDLLASVFGVALGAVCLVSTLGAGFGGLPATFGTAFGAGFGAGFGTDFGADFGAAFGDGLGAALACLAAFAGAALGLAARDFTLGLLIFSLQIVS